MKSFTDKQGAEIVVKLIKVIQDNKEYLSEIDGAIGDGDHGINMNKGFTLTKERLPSQETTFSSYLKTLGTLLLTEIGGSMGPLYGTFFRNMGKGSGRIIDRDTFAVMLNAALEGLSSLGNAKVGDKTIMDTLIPAVEAYNAACSADKDFVTALEALQVAAEKGKESTYDMVAKVGRSSRLGERSRGCLDAGATSCNMILQSMAESIKELIGKQKN